MYISCQKAHHSNVLNDFLGDVFGIEFGAEFKLQSGVLLDILGEHLLVQLEPRWEAFSVGVLEAEVPNLAEADGFDDLQAEGRVEFVFILLR